MSDLLSCVNEKARKERDDWKSKARAGQKIFINDLNKNVLFVILAYLKCEEIHAFLKSNRRVYVKLIKDPFFNHVAAEALSTFFFQ